MSAAHSVRQARAAGELAAVRAARPDQRLRRRHGRDRAHGRAADRLGRVRHRLDDAHRLLHRQLRRRQGLRQSRLRPTRRQLGTQARAGPRLAGRPAGAVHDHLGAELGLDHRRQRAARRQPGPCLVDDRDHEDRSRRAEVARPRRRPQRIRRLSRGRRHRLPHRLSRRRVRPCARCRSISASAMRVLGTALSILLVRDTRDHVRLEGEQPSPRSPRSASGRSSALTSFRTAISSPPRRPGSSTTSTTA